MARPRLMAQEARELIIWVGMIRRDLPNDYQLAEMAGCSVSWVQKLMARSELVQERGFIDERLSA